MYQMYWEGRSADEENYKWINSLFGFHYLSQNFLKLLSMFRLSSCNFKLIFKKNQFENELSKYII